MNLERLTSSFSRTAAASGPAARGGSGTLLPFGELLAQHTAPAPSPDPKSASPAVARPSVLLASPGGAALAADAPA
ncbi:MAG: hypothetical protein KGN76_10740, partial [Acidobacteriota bacterium]|nr:hypothetical protein [Acidobacteriota bacterium]